MREKKNIRRRRASLFSIVTRTEADSPPVTFGNDRGFSFVELLITFIILALLMIIGAPSLNYLRDTAKTARAADEIRGLERDIGAWAAEKGALPDQLTQLYPNRPNPPKDPWGNNYVYHKAADAGDDRRTNGADLNDDYDLFSTGPDAHFFGDVDDPRSQDDVIRIGNGSWVGLVRKMNEFP